jgi:hypothetical protein
MRYTILLALLFFCGITHAQKSGQAVKAKTGKPAAKPAIDEPLTAALVFEKVGKTKLTFNWFNYFAGEPLQKHKELMYFLLERFTAQQVRKIMAISRKPYASYPYDTKKEQYSKLNGYIIKTFRSYYKPDQFQNMALVYLPYEENSGDEIPEQLRVSRPEGLFILMESINIFWTGMPLLEKWEEQPLEKLPNFTADCKDLLYTNETPAPAPPPATNATTGTANNSEKKYVKTQMTNYINHLLAAVKSYAKLGEGLSAVDKSCWENSKTNSKAATLSYNSYNAWYSALDELKQAYAALEKLNAVRFAPICKEWASIELKISEAKTAMGAFINTERASGIVKRMQDQGKVGSWAEIWFQTVKELVSYHDGKLKPGFEDFAISSKKINDLANQCGN